MNRRFKEFVEVEKKIENMGQNLGYQNSQTNYNAPNEEELKKLDTSNISWDEEIETNYNDSNEEELKKLDTSNISWDDEIKKLEDLKIELLASTESEKYGKLK